MLGLFFFAIAVATLAAMMIAVHHSYKLEQRFHLFKRKEGR